MEGFASIASQWRVDHQRNADVHYEAHASRQCIRVTATLWHGPILSVCKSRFEYGAHINEEGRRVAWCIKLAIVSARNYRSSEAQLIAWLVSLLLTLSSG